MREGIGITNSADVVASALLQVLFDQGWDTGRQPVRLRAMLNDLLGASAVDHEAAVDALVVGAELGAAAAASAPSEVQSDAVAERLREWGLAAETAAWVRDTWGWAYRQLALDTPTAEFPDETVLPPAASAATTELPDDNRLSLASMPFAVTAPSSEQPPTLAASEISGVLLGSSIGATKDGESQGGEPVATPRDPASSATRTSLLTRRHVAIASAAAIVLIGAVVGVALAGEPSSPGSPAKGSSGDPVKTASATAAHTTKSTSSTVSTTTTNPTTTSSSTPATSGQSTPPANSTPGAAAPARAPGSTGKSTPAPSPSPSPAPSPAATPTTSPPTTTPTTAAPTPAPPPPPPPVASDWSISYTPEYGSGQFYVSTESAAQISQDVSGSWSYLVVLNPGNTTYYDIINTSGSNYLQWQPNVNGAGYLHIYYYVVNAEGERSNQATLTVNVNCNTSTQCNAPAPPP